jgi:hypothetical protein
MIRLLDGKATLHAQRAFRDRTPIVVPESQDASVPSLFLGNSFGIKKI